MFIRPLRVHSINLFNCSYAALAGNKCFQWIWKKCCLLFYAGNDYKYQFNYVGVFILNAVAKVLTSGSLHPNCDLALVPSLSISFCRAAETEINSGPLSHRILDDCLSWISRLTQTGVICLPSLSKNTALVRCNKRPKITDFFLSFYVFFLLLLETTWYRCWTWNRDHLPQWSEYVTDEGGGCATVWTSLHHLSEVEIVTPLFFGMRHTPFLVHCFSFFPHVYPLWIFSLFPSAALF